MLEFFQALLICWLKSCLWYIIYHISLFFPTPFFWVQNGQRWLRIGQSFCLQQKFTFVRFLFFPHVCFAYIVMRPLCTKSHCDADSADIALEVTPRMKIGTSWRTVDTCSRWWCRIIRGNNAPKLSDNNHIQWHWPWKLSLRNTLCSRNTHGLMGSRKKVGNTEKPKLIFIYIDILNII